MRNIKTLLLITSMLISSAVFGQSANILEALSTSYDHTQDAVTSVAMAVENMTEAYNYLSSNGAKRFIRFTRDNLDNALQQIETAKQQANSATNLANNLNNQEITQAIEDIQSRYTAIEDNIQEALNAVKQAQEERQASAIDGALKKASQAIESGLIQIGQTLEKTNEVVLQIS